MKLAFIRVLVAMSTRQRSLAADPINELLSSAVAQIEALGAQEHEVEEHSEDGEEVMVACRQLNGVRDFISESVKGMFDSLVDNKRHVSADPKKVRKLNIILCHSFALLDLLSLSHSRVHALSIVLFVCLFCLFVCLCSVP
jgi:hypothetical protein